MKMRLIPVVYFGFTAMDRRFSSPMLPWIFSEIRKREYTEKLSLGVEDGCLQAYNQDFEVQFSHKLTLMTRFSQADSDPCTFLYLLRDDVEQLLYCYLFSTYKQNDVNELYQQMKEHQTAPRSTPAASNLTSLCVDISPSCSNFFEVLYIGKIKVWHKKVPDSFIDDALDKFKQHDQEKNRKKLARLKSEMDLRRGSVDSSSLTDTSSSITSGVPRLQRSHSLLSNLSIKSPEIDRKVPTCIERITEDNNENDEQKEHEEEKETTLTLLEKEKEELRKMSLDKPPVPVEQLEADNFENLIEEQNKMELKQDSDEHNRTMVLQVDRTDLRLISPDRKVILLHKQHKDVTTCIQGVNNSTHFGFISREASNPGAVATYIGFVFKCESASVASEAVAAITQAFNNPSSNQHHHDGSKHRPSITSCDHCPMVWFHRLCCEIESMPERKQQAAIMRKIDQLDEEEQNLLMTKFSGAETDSLREQNEFLMMLLRAHCEMKQGKHQHDTLEQRSEFLNQYLGGGNTIFMKAKRSLSNSFDHLLKRRGSRDDFNISNKDFGSKDLTLPILQALSRESSPQLQPPPLDSTSVTSDDMRSRSSTMSSTPSTQDDAKVLKSPMMDIFMKVGSSNPQQNSGSWRQAIFKRVITPSPSKPSLQGQGEGHQGTYTKEELRALWRKSIHQAILLVRMEKENARIRAKQEESAVKRIKLEYDEMRGGKGGGNDVWDTITSSGSKPDVDLVIKAVKQGIPRGKRGEVWLYLVEHNLNVGVGVGAQSAIAHAPVTTYETLLKQLTSHQHAILIDLGRTFPGHSYYQSPLGPGQLALFNLLKAYSLLDPEVGYCQGLSFVAGVLLLHMDEPSAFSLLRHLMYGKNLREQYLPDMVGLQIKLYQLSRLLRDHLPKVYNHLDQYEVAPTLYAAPWLLTIFASQFPLGFVTRVFDLIFVEGTDVIFKVILALLTQHQAAILECESFEDIMNFLKVKLPMVDNARLLEGIMRRVEGMDVKRQLDVYQVEYNVLKEEMQAIQNQLEMLSESESALKQSQEVVKGLEDKVEGLVKGQRKLEEWKQMQQVSMQRLETCNRSMEVTIMTLGAFLGGLIEGNPGLSAQIPGDVRRILEKIPLSEEKKVKDKPKNLFSMFNKTAVNPNKLMVKSLSTGRITLNDNRSAAADVLRANSLNVCNPKEKLSFFNSQIYGNSNCNFDQKLISPSNSIDSGVSTPTTHGQKDVIDESEEDSMNNNNNNEGQGPPLNHSDLNVIVNHRELKKVKSIRDMGRNTSPSPGFGSNQSIVE